MGWQWHPTEENYTIWSVKRQKEIEDKPRPGVVTECREVGNEWRGGHANAVYRSIVAVLVLPGRTWQE